MTPKTEAHGSAAKQGRFAYAGLDRVIHEKARLGILASLAANEAGLVFNDLKQLCSLTDGNLNRHLAVLSDAGLVKAHKTVRGPRTQTRYRLTPDGRERFVEYIDVLERVVSDAHPNAKARRAKAGSSTKWSPA